MPATIPNFSQQNKVVILTDAATITPNCDTTDLGVILSLTQTTVFANPIGTPRDGQLLQLRLSSTVSRAISFGTAYQSASSLVLPQSTTGGSKEDYIAFRYNATDVKYDLIGTTIGAGVSGITRSIISINTATTGGAATTVDYVYIATGTFIYTQPTAVGNTNRYTIINSGTGIITIVFTSGQNADTSTTIALNPEVALDFISNNTNWIII